MPKLWNLTVPEFLPKLIGGKGEDPGHGGCILQVIDFLDRGGWSDRPVCVHVSLRDHAISVNDGVLDHERQKLYLLLPRLMGTAKAGTRYDVRTAGSEDPLSSQMERFAERYAEYDDSGEATKDMRSIEFLTAMLNEFERITKPKASDAKKISKATWEELLKVDKQPRIRVPVA